MANWGMGSRCALLGVALFSPLVLAAPPGPIRVLAGGTAAYTDSAGNVWSADTGYSGGLTYSNTNAISGTSDATLYHTERYGSANKAPASFSYAFSVPNGEYAVTLKFAETLLTAAGEREFNVLINGIQVLTEFDIYAQCGYSTACDRQFIADVTDGTITLQFTPGAIQSPKVDAIQIVPQSSLFRIGAGATAAYTDQAGYVWSADEDYSGGKTFANTATVLNTLAPLVYNHERYGANSAGPSPFSYVFDVPNGNYTVSLGFSETLSGLTSVGQRIFDVAVGGATVLSNFDIIAAAGAPDTAYTQAFSTQVSNGQLEISLSPGSVQCPKVDGVEILVAPVDALTFTTPSQTMTAGVCSGPFSLQTVDATGNPVPVTMAMPITLASTGTDSVNFYGDSACATELSGPQSIAAGSGTLTFYARATVSGTAPLEASASGVTPAQQSETVVAGAPASLALAPASQTLSAGICSAAVTVQAYDSYGNRATFPSATSIGLSSSLVGAALSFYSDSKCSQEVTSLALAAGSGMATFHFSSELAGAATLTATASGTSLLATQDEIVNPGAAFKLAFGAGPSTAVSGALLSPVPQVDVEDAYGNLVMTASPTVTVSPSPSASLGGTVSVSAANGVASFSNLSIAAPGSYSLIARSSGLASAKSPSIDVLPALSIVTASLPEAVQASAYVGAIAVSGGVAPYHFSVVSGALPAGISLSSSGSLSGTPTKAGPASFVVQVTDSGAIQQHAQASLSINVLASLAIAAAPLPSPTQGAPYSGTVMATGGVAPYHWSETGSLPPGLNFSEGSVTGTPTAPGSYTFKIVVSDSEAQPQTASQSFTLGVRIVGITVAAAQSLQAAVSANPAPGTTFILAPGFHHDTVTAIPPGDIFTSPSGTTADGVYEDGATPLPSPSWSPVKVNGAVAYWTAPVGAPNAYGPYDSRNCETDFPECYHPQNLYWVQSPNSAGEVTTDLTPVKSLSAVAQGTWYYEMYGLQTATIVANNGTGCGSGYKAGDLLSVNDAVGTGGTIVVSGVTSSGSAAGAVTAVTIADFGYRYPASATETTTDTTTPTASGCSVAITAGSGGILNNVYVSPANSPATAGGQFEIGSRSNLFLGSSYEGQATTNVTIQGLIVERYASEIQDAAIEAWNSGWIIQNNETRYNHGAGIGGRGYGTGDSGLNVINNLAHHNGTLGITGGSYENGLISGNTVYDNNIDHTNAGFGAGGIKIGAANHLRVTNNTVYGNIGNGIHLDVNSINSTIDHNSVHDNLNEGIRYEISNLGTITNNTVYNNGGNPWETVGGLANINYAASSGGTIENNIVVAGTYGMGIAVDYNAARGGCGTGCTVPVGMNVSGNTIYLGTKPAAAMVDSGGTGSQWQNVAIFDNNTYCGSSSADAWWYEDAPTTKVVDFPAWQAYGQDAQSTVSSACPTAP